MCKQKLNINRVRVGRIQCITIHRLEKKKKKMNQPNLKRLLLLIILDLHNKHYCLWFKAEKAGRACLVCGIETQPLVKLK